MHEHCGMLFLSLSQNLPSSISSTCCTTKIWSESTPITLNYIIQHTILFLSSPLFWQHIIALTESFYQYISKVMLPVS
jgi:hypothetical protein